MLHALVACAVAADGDLWLEIEETAPGGDRVLLNLPVSELRAATEPAILRTPQGEVDLAAEARALATGKERSWTTTDGERVTLANRRPRGEPATLLAIAIGGREGAGLEATFPLDREGIDRVNGSLEGELVADLDGLDLRLDDDACAQLRRSPPVLLVEIVGPRGNGLRIRTR